MNKATTVLPEEDNFGAYLRDTRFTNGIDLDTVAAETKIRAELLDAIEKENHDRLPPPAYVRGMIRTFARAVGADPQEAIRRYNNNRGFSTQSRILAQSAPGQDRRRWPWLLALVALAIVIASGAAYMLNRYNPISDTPDLTRPQPKTEKGSTDAVPPAVVPESKPSLEQSPPAAVNESGIETVTGDLTVPSRNGYLLNITVSEKTWLKVLVDDQEAMEYALNAGDRLDLEAATSINLLIGNAGGVQLTLNDNPYPVPGKSGQVVNVVIP